MIKYERITQAVRVLAALGHGDEFSRGVAALAEMLRREPVRIRYDQHEYPAVNERAVVAGARSLAALDVDADFSRGVLALALALLPPVLADPLLAGLDELRAALPPTNIQGKNQ